MQYPMAINESPACITQLLNGWAQGDDAAKERVRAFLEKRAGKVKKGS